jgi:hypothetical protein
VLDCLGEVIEAHLTKNAVGEFVLPGLLKISTVRKPAVKERITLYAVADVFSRRLAGIKRGHQPNQTGQK